ncbi:MAG TPA: hypothetical protein VEQ85_14770 [Lacipirellulaceae bacterium]|nr:hypothetical protein [Lacipirellulaceae bacterium]
MATDIRWRVSLSASCLHAAACRAAGLHAADAVLAASIDGASDALISELMGSHWPVDDVLRLMTSLAADFENNRELVARTLAKLRLSAPEAVANRVSGAVADVEAALRRHAPEIVDELAARSRPLREQWDARGPGMLVELARLTDPAAVPDQAEVVLAAPYAGGHGWAHAGQNRVTFEAVLVNPHPALPETVRLAWLVGQLASDLPRLGDALPAGRQARAFELAMLAPALAAGEIVELTRCDEAEIAHALDAWRVRGDLPADAAARIWAWWNAWLDHPTSWPVAVAALDGLLAATP